MSAKIKFVVGALIMALIGLFFMSAKLDSAREDVAAAQERAAHAEQNVEQLEADIRQAEQNYKLYKTRFQAEAKLVDKLTKERVILHEKLEQQSRDFETAFSKLRSVDKRVNDWADLLVPSSVVELLRQEAETDSNHNNENRIHNAKNPGESVNSNRDPLAGNPDEWRSKNLHQRFNSSAQIVQL